jgi:hypothetical protein
MKIVAMHVVTDYLRLFRSLGVNVPLALAPLAPFQMAGAAAGPETVTTQAVTAPALGAAQQQAGIAGGGLPAAQKYQQQAVPLAGQPQQQQVGVGAGGGLQQPSQQQYGGVGGVGGLGAQQQRNI